MLIDTDYRALRRAGQEALHGKSAFLPDALCGALVVIGNFDGVHRGHQALLQQASARAGESGIKLVVLSFTPHPRRYFQPDQPPFLLSLPAQKAGWLLQAGADAVVHLAFDEELAALTAEDFIRDVLVTGLRAGAVMVGENFRFGRMRGGDVALLAAQGALHGFAVHAMALVPDEGRQRLSSEAVREALRQGDVARANRMLGRPWQVTGIVIHGEKRGRQLGFPTANIALGDYVHPAYGVYAARARLADSGAAPSLAAVVNIGCRPTLGDGAPLLEAHFLDFSGDLYGREPVLDFYHYLRPEQRFSSLDALAEQIARDRDQAKQYLDSPAQNMA